MKKVFAPLLAAAFLALSAFVFSGCKNNYAGNSVNIPIIDKAIKDTASNFYVGFDEYPSEMKKLPIGVFDSGTGGLTVLEKILSLDRFDNITGADGKDEIIDFAGEHFIYLADQANMPYGNYDAEGKSDYLRELAVKDAIFLLDDNYYKDAFEETPSGVKPRVKILIIACNTATAYGLKSIQSMLEQSGSGVKVIGVINAGSKATLDMLGVKDGDDPMAIGVLATPGTIASGAYERTIKEELAARGISAQVDVVSQSGYGFAEAVDSEPDYVNPMALAVRSTYRGPKIGDADNSIKLDLLKAYNFDFSGNRMLARRGPDGRYSDLQLNSAVNYARFNLVSLVERHRASGSTAPIRAIILGCTHYPFLLETLKQTVEELRTYKSEGSFPYRNLLADDIIFVDPAVYTAIECYNTLRADDNLAHRITPQKVEGYISVPSENLDDKYLTEDGHLTYEFKYGRESGTEDVTTKQVPFSKENIDSNNLERIKKLLPYTYELIAPALQ